MNDSNIREWKQKPERFFESSFAHIATTRMQGLPIVNSRLHVRALGFERFQGQWLGSVVTPWSILIVMACGHRESWPLVKTTQVTTIKFPSGDYEFIGMADPILGRYLACRLMSPLLHIPDQKTAESIAMQSLRLMRGAQRLADMEEPRQDLSQAYSFGQSRETHSTSRRNLLRGTKS